MNLPSFRRSAAVLAGALLLWSSQGAFAQTIPQGTIVVDLENFAQVPNSGSNAPARINYLTSAPDGRLFANDQRGILYRISANGATVVPYLTLTQYIPLRGGDGEVGFQGFAFHPDFNTAGTAGYGKFYTMASQSDTTATATFVPGVAGANRDHDEVLLEWTAANPSAGTFTPANAAQPFREVMRIARPASNHNAGYIAFNPTATTNAERLLLYIGTGDSGGGGDPLNLAQMLGNAYGAILRINPLLPGVNNPRPSDNGQYSIPGDNPYYNGVTTFLREKYAAGFRNPQRFTWDNANGNLFIADIGQGRVEEIDLGVPGANYGWNQREGSFVFAGGNIGANVRDDGATSGFTYPIAEYFHFGSLGNAVTTGPVYRGNGLPELNGRLIFSDFPNGTAYTLNANQPGGGGQGPITELRLRSGGVEMSFLNMIRQVNPSATRADLRFGTDRDGNIYFLNKQDGVIRRIQMPPGTGVHPLYFAGEQALGSDTYFLTFPNGNPFGYYSYLSDPRYIFHYDLGYEYVFDAADGLGGVYLYDFATGTFFYTSPTFPFPYLYDFSLNSVVYYYPDPNDPQHYNTNGVRYFYVFNTGEVITK